MATRATMIPEESQARSLAELREKLLADKAARRRYLVSAPIPEKLRILEEMRDLTRALKSQREENKARVRAARAASAK